METGSCCSINAAAVVNKSSCSTTDGEVPVIIAIEAVPVLYWPLVCCGSRKHVSRKSPARPELVDQAPKSTFVHSGLFNTTQPTDLPNSNLARV